MMFKLLKLFIDVRECLNSLMKDEWLSFIKISLEKNDNLSEIINIMLQTVNQWEIFHQRTFFFLIKEIVIIIIIINSYILVTSIRSTHEKLYAICIEWTKLSEIENHSQSTRLLHAVETVSFETMYQICSRWLHVKERVF